jgi:hypothetical protein
MQIGKYSFGVGDRFAHQGEAQLSAVIQGSNRLGIEIIPVWNKSNREHAIVHSVPADTRREADAAVAKLNYGGAYYVDADHVNLANVDSFIASSDFFTLDVADRIGEKVPEEEIEAFVAANKHYVRLLGEMAFDVSEMQLRSVAGNFLPAVREAGCIYRHVREVKGHDGFVTEVSMDEVLEAQSPTELFFILKMIADEHIPVQTIAPKFTGRFNKGVDYAGDTALFAREFEEDLLVMDCAVRAFGLPAGLKLSIHSGSDKFSIYPVMGRLIKKYDKGIHVKTAGTTWLEELTGLAASGDRDAVALVKAVYEKAFGRFDELCAPYSTVLDIKKDELPKPAEVNGWTGEKIANTLRHIEGHPDYSPDFRQLLHVGYRIAAEFGTEYTGALKRNRDIIARQVVENLLDRHLLPMFNNIIDK